MTAHLADTIARALIRGVTYRLAWHAPIVLPAVVFVLACAWLSRREGR